MIYDTVIKTGLVLIKCYFPQTSLALSLSSMPRCVQDNHLSHFSFSFENGRDSFFGVLQFTNT